MSKYIKLEDAIDALVERVKIIDGAYSACVALRTLPTIDIVHCKDCISRGYLLNKVYDMDNDNLVVDIKDIENAPSVMPSRAGGEWLLDGRCSECLASPLTTHKNFCPNCGAKMKGADDDSNSE